MKIKAENSDKTDDIDDILVNRVKKMAQLHSSSTTLGFCATGTFILLNPISRFATFFSEKKVCRLLFWNRTPPQGFCSALFTNPRHPRCDDDCWWEVLLMGEEFKKGSRPRFPVKNQAEKNSDLLLFGNWQSFLKYPFIGNKMKDVLHIKNSTTWLVSKYLNLDQCCSLNWVGMVKNKPGLQGKVNVYKLTCWKTTWLMIKYVTHFADFSKVEPMKDKPPDLWEEFTL